MEPKSSGKSTTTGLATGLTQTNSADDADKESETAPAASETPKSKKDAGNRNAANNKLCGMKPAEPWAGQERYHCSECRLDSFVEDGKVNTCKGPVSV